MTLTLLLPFLLLLSSGLNNIFKIGLGGTEDKKPPFYYVDSYWVDSVMNDMSLDERIAQLLMYPAYSNQGFAHKEQIEKLIDEYKIGGLIFMQGSPERQAELINHYQGLSEVPLLIAMDAEWSVSMRLTNTVLYPRQMMLGAISDNELIYEMGVEFARQLNRVGAQVNFAPVADVNNNPLNPVINSRSFGEDIDNVYHKSYHYMRSLQDNQVLAVGKHFPGHGDTNVDSHYDLPVIRHDIERLDSIELYPFRKLIKNGIGGIMTAHLFVPAIDSTHNLPSSLSEKAIDGILKREMDFEGLIFTDALNMGGITNYYKPGESDLKALLAGNDILLFPNDPNLVIGKIKQAIEDGLISEEEINHRCRKVLLTKYWAGLSNFEPIDIELIEDDLNNQTAKHLRQKLIENAITLVKNDNQIIPIKDLQNTNIASISFGDSRFSKFQSRMDYYAEVDHFVFENAVRSLGRKGLLDSLGSYDIVMASVHKTNRNPASNFNISMRTIGFLDDLSKISADIVFNVFGNPYSLSLFNNLNNFEAIIVSYNDWNLTNDLSSQLVFGGIPALGRLPVSIDGYFEAGAGESTEQIRLKYTDYPESVGVSSSALLKVDSLLLEGLEQGAYPGVHVMAARGGQVFYNKTFGYHTGSKEIAVSDFSIYDLASLTKVLSTTAGIMHLYEEGKIDLDSSISSYLPYLEETNKSMITIRNILAHQAGLRSWIPYYLETIANDSIFESVYRQHPDDLFNVRVADNMYLYSAYIDTLYNRLIESNLNNRGYVYSDVGFYFLKDLIEVMTGEGIDTFVKEHFYESLGAMSLRYNPRDYFELDLIVPTKRDNIFRNQLLQGYVHDHGAAMLGGVAGHAGLFGNANDVMKFMQMFLNNGVYGGVRYFDEGTVNKFTSYNNRSVSRRGLGFDKPAPVGNNNNNRIGGKYSTESAYGHTGFTGTMLWVDPEYDLVYVFLSNRIYPDSDNRTLLRLKTRGKVLEAFYGGIGAHCVRLNDE